MVQKQLSLDITKSILSVVITGIFLSTGINAYLQYSKDRQFLMDVAGDKAAMMSENASLAMTTKIQEHLDILETISINPLIVDSIHKQNETFQAEDAGENDEINQIDQDWLAGSPNVGPLQQQILSTPTSKYLNKIQLVFPENVETIVTDRNGLVMAMTNLTTDYYQADEAWWQAAFSGKVYFDTPVFDESTKTWAILTAIPVFDTREDGTVIGVLRGTLDVTTLLETIFYVRDGEFLQSAFVSSKYSIYRNQGGALTVSPVPPELESIFEDQPEGWVKHATGLDDYPSLVAVYPIYALGRELGWVVTAYPEAIVHQSLLNALRQNIIVALILMTVLGVISGLISRYILRILHILKDDVSSMADGNYGDTFSSRILVSNDPDISSLLRSFVKMKEAIQNREQALIRSEEQYRLLVETMDEGVMLMDMDGQVTYVNRTLTRMLALSQNEILLQNPIHFFPEISSGELTDWQDVLQKTRKFETILATRAGEHLPVSVSLQPVFLENEEKSGMMAVISDISLRKKNEADVQKKLNELAGLREIDLTILNKTTFTDLVRVVFNQLQHELNITAGAIHIFRSNSNQIDFSDVFGINYSVRQDEVIFSDDSRARLIAAGISLLDGDDFPEFKVHDGLYTRQYRRVYFSPIVILDRLKGFIELAFEDEPAITEPWLSYFHSVITQTAVGIDKIELLRSLQIHNQNLQRSYDGLINGWAKALELRDEETRGHSDRVTNLAMRMAERFGFAGEALNNFRVGCILHDIGKMGVPDTILLKPGKLSEDEWVVMRKHPEMAYQLLSDLPFLKDALDVPYCHHELWNGSGYPKGLAGEDIPLAARIFTVVDVWDALSSDRPYRKAWDREKVIEYILDNRGKLYDPRVVDRFMQIIQAEA